MSMVVKSSAVVAATAPAFPAIAAQTDTDPIFALIDRWKETFTTAETASDDDSTATMAAFDGEFEAMRAVLEAVPTTLAGIRAKIDFATSEQHVTAALTTAATDQPLREFLDTLYESARVLTKAA